VVGREQRNFPGVAELEGPGAGGDDALVASLRQAKADGVLAAFITYARKKIRGATSRVSGCQLEIFGRS
jgi:hypothetical protein